MLFLGYFKDLVARSLLPRLQTNLHHHLTLALTLIFFLESRKITPTAYIAEKSLSSGFVFNTHFSF